MNSRGKERFVHHIVNAVYPTAEEDCYFAANSMQCEPCGRCHLSFQARPSLPTPSRPHQRAPAAEWQVLALSERTVSSGDSRAPGQSNRSSAGTPHSRAARCSRTRVRQPTTTAPAGPCRARQRSLHALVPADMFWRRKLSGPPVTALARAGAAGWCGMGGALEWHRGPGVSGRCAPSSGVAPVSPAVSYGRGTSRICCLLLPAPSFTAL